ncbi:unnamed protein product [Calypogeia fissa]
MGLEPSRWPGPNAEPKRSAEEKPDGPQNTEAGAHSRVASERPVCIKRAQPVGQIGPARHHPTPPGTPPGTTQRPDWVPQKVYPSRARKSKEPTSWQVDGPKRGRGATCRK